MKHAHKCRMACWNLPGSSDLSWPQKKLYWELMVSSTLDHLVEWLGWSQEEIRSQWNWVPGSSFLNNSEFSLTWQLAQNVLPFNNWDFKAYLADMPDCPHCGSGLEEMALHTFYYCDWVHSL